MREPVEVLALRKEVLIARSTLCRLKIRRDAAAVRGTLSPARSGMALAGAAPVRELGLGLQLAGCVADGWRAGRARDPRCDPRQGRARGIRLDRAAKRPR